MWQWKWLHYDSGGGRAFCYLCVKALETGKITAEGNIDEAIALHWCCNWKDMFGDKGRLTTHKSSSVHERAVELIEMLSWTTCEIGEQLSSAHTELNWREATKLISNNINFDETRLSIVGRSSYFPRFLYYMALFMACNWSWLRRSCLLSNFKALLIHLCVPA